MLIHIALFAWHDDVSQSEITNIFAQLRTLKENIDGVQDLYCGKNFSQYAEGFTHAIVVLLENRESLNAYRSHPEHVRLAKKLESLEKKSIGIDFET